MTFTQTTLQSILELGALGIHPLFAQEQIQRAFQHEHTVTDTEDVQVKARLERGLAQVTLLPTIGEQAEFIASLPASAQSAVCRLYFTLIGEAKYAERVVH